MMVTAEGGADRIAEGVGGAGDEPCVGAARVPSRAGAQISPN